MKKRSAVGCRWERGGGEAVVVMEVVEVAVVVTVTVAARHTCSPARK